MKQKITIKATSGYTGGRFDIISAYQVNDEILVLLENNSAAGGGDVECNVEKSFEVTTDSWFSLPVKFYIVNSRENRAFNTSQFIGTSPDKTNPFHHLLSVYEFNELVTEGKCLAKRETPIFDLRTLLREENEYDTHLKSQPLEDQNEFLIARLLQQNPTCNQIMSRMIKAEILNGHPVDNTNIIGNFIAGMQKLNDVDQQKMLRLYRALYNGGGDNCLLTGYIHDVITDDIFGRVKYNRCGLEVYLALVEDLQPLTPAMARTIFMEPHFYIMVHREVAKFDPTFECERYLFATITDPAKCGQLASMFYNDLYHHKGDGPLYPWMTAELFKLLVDNIGDDKFGMNIWSLKSGFATLHQFGMLESHQDKLLANIDAASTFGALRRHDALTANDIEPALANNSFTNVLDFFDTLNYTGQWSYQTDKKEVGSMMTSILHHQELTDAVCELSRIYEVKNKELFAKNHGSLPSKDHDEFKQQYKQVLKELIAAAYPAVPDNKFFASQPISLAERVAEIRKKFGVEDMQKEHLPERVSRPSM
jgi:hypothetical protein